ncbi:MAG: hypothetical protein KME23_27350 [Goleter apudmare HA4340-LM2]|nr:hypothetical protein [Goleter apudmare HA4340-LM2]
MRRINLFPKNLDIHPKSQVAASIISYEEQMRGWLSYIAKAQSIEQQVETYKLPAVGQFPSSRLFTFA